MKKLFFLFFLCLASFAFAQNLTSITARVYQNGSLVDTQEFTSFVAAPGIDETLTLNTAALSPGIYSFTITVTDENNLTSIPVSGTFLQEELQVSGSNLTELEYFIDSDPGEGLGTPITFAASPAISITENLNLSALSPGFHTLYLRGKDETGKWGFYDAKSIYVESAIGYNDVVEVEALEYFVDNDPGEGLGTAIPVTQSSLVSLTESLSTSGLSSGFHTLFLRGKIAGGSWGPYASQLIYVEPAVGAGDIVLIDQVEYFVDTDPGAGLGTSISVTTAADLSFVETLTLNGLTPGFHTLYIRGRLESGSWGPYSSQLIYVEPSVGAGDVVVVEALEYFIDTDPGQGLGTPISVTAGNSVNLNTTLATDALSPGFHTFYLRGKLQNGSWGPYTSQPIYVESTPQTGSTQIVEVEYFFDSDPGVGQATTASLPLPATAINELISLSSAALAPGTHTISVRAKEETGAWGHYYTQSFDVLAATLVESVADGNWSNPAIWSGGVVPGLTDSVSVQHSITLDVPTDSVLSITLTGTGGLDLAGNDLHVYGRFFADVGSTFTSNAGQLYLDGGTQTYQQSGNLAHDVLIFGGTGTKTIDVAAVDQITINDSLHVESGVTLAFPDFPALRLNGNADFISEGTVVTAAKWSLAANGTNHQVFGGDFFDVEFLSATSISMLGDFNYDGSFISPGNGSTLNVGEFGLDLGSVWNLAGADDLLFGPSATLVANGETTFTMTEALPTLVISSGAEVFTATTPLVFSEGSNLLVQTGVMNAQSLAFSGSGGIDVTGGQLNASEASISLGNGGSISVNGGGLQLTGAASAIQGNTITDAYSMTLVSGTLSLNDASISELGGNGITLNGGSLTLSNVDFSNGLGDAYLTFGAGFNGQTFTGNTFEAGPTFNVAMLNGVNETITFDQYGGPFGGPDFDNPGDQGTINWTNPQAPDPVITVVAPNGGQTLVEGTSYEISWTEANIPGTDAIEVRWSSDGGGSFGVIADGQASSFGGTFLWTVPGEPGVQNLIEVANTTQGVSDQSDAAFTIEAAPVPVISVVSPNGGEELFVGSDYQVSWTTENINPTDAIEIRLSQDGGNSYSLLAGGIFDDYSGSFNWTVTNLQGTNNLIQVANITQGIADESDAPFTIVFDNSPPNAFAGTEVTPNSFTANWSDRGAEAYFLDVATDNAFEDLLQDYNNLNVGATTSATVSGLDYGTNYYYRVRADFGTEVSASSNEVRVKTTVSPQTQADSAALRQIYNALGGANWSEQVNWTTERFRNWDRVVLNASLDRVLDVDLSALGAEGDMPNPFSGVATNGLTAMTNMNLANNFISGLMDFTDVPITTLDVSGNNLEFDDLEPVMGIANLNYQNQADLQFDGFDGQPVKIFNLADPSLEVVTGGTANTYRWFRNGIEIFTGNEFNVNGNLLQILDIDFNNMGAFTAQVRNELVPDLTLSVGPQEILATAQIDLDIVGSGGSTIPGNVDAYILRISEEGSYDTLRENTLLNARAPLTFQEVVLGNYLIAIDPRDKDSYIQTYSGNAFLWEEADTVRVRRDTVGTLVITAVPPELTEGPGNLTGTIEEDLLLEPPGRIDARRRAARRKCGLRRRTGGGRPGQAGDFELIAYGETNANGEFEFGFLPQGTYRFFVEYPGIPLDPEAEVEFTVGEEGVSDTDFRLEAFVTQDGIQVSIEVVLGAILEYFKNLQVYPNPSSDYLKISYRHLKATQVRAELVDLSGTSRWSEDLRNGFDGTVSIDVRDFPEGMYILRIFDKEKANEHVVGYRVLIQK